MGREHIRRHGKVILLGDGCTAMEGREGGMNTITIRQNGKILETYRGSSIGFGKVLTEEDKQYLEGLKEWTLA